MGFFQIQFVGPVGPRLQRLMPKNVEIPSSSLVSDDEYHLIMEYKVHNSVSLVVSVFVKAMDAGLREHFLGCQPGSHQTTDSSTALQKHLNSINTLNPPALSGPHKITAHCDMTGLSSQRKITSHCYRTALSFQHKIIAHCDRTDYSCWHKITAHWNRGILLLRSYLRCRADFFPKIYYF